MSVITAQREFKARYEKFVRIAFLGALLVHVVAFVVWPEYIPTAYELREKEMKVIELPPEINIPPPPQEIQRPQIPMEADPSEDVDEETTIAPTSLDMENLPPAPPPVTDRKIKFVAFDTPPEPVFQATPEYPRLAREAELEGIVVVVVTIDETGRVIDAEVVESPSPVFNESAIAAARKSRFKPAKQRDIPVPCRISMRFNFHF